MRTVAVIGCGFGDEGKGKIVSSLCQEMDTPLVVRYSGGQQAGHHVVLPGVDHVFSNFGSGTLQGCPTYWSKYCTVDPVGIINELDILESKGVNPDLWIDWRCPVTTPYEKVENLRADADNKHGTCGVGFGLTHQREEDRYSLLYSDLFNRTILGIKMDMIGKYYGFTVDLNGFYDSILNLYTRNSICGVDGKPVWSKGIIFEGSQGLLLDQDIGFFPHVTRSNVGSKNILEMGYRPEIYLVTRAYQTRHGNGPMTHLPNNNFLNYVIKENPYEQNPDDGHQGMFRRAPLDLDLLKYSIGKDRYIKKSSINLVITCVDIVKDDLWFRRDGRYHKCDTVDEFVDKIRWFLDINNDFNIDNVYLSRTPFAEKLEKYSEDYAPNPKEN